MKNHCQTTSVVLASPREPSGGSWLINCLLHLGVRVNFKPTVDRVWRSVGRSHSPSDMWEAAPSGQWRLHPRAEALKKWLPILEERQALTFREDFEALYVQDLPRQEFQGTQNVLFVRDPRDSIQSFYRRIRPDMTLGSFVRFPHPETLLDAIDHWQLFVESWLSRRGIFVYRFEDYKANADALLAEISSDLGLAASHQDIAQATAGSSYEQARAAEERYRAAHPRDQEVAMRAGRVGEWQNSEELRELSREIEKRIGPLLVKLGYKIDGSSGSTKETSKISHLRFLSALGDVELPHGLRETAAAQDPLTCPLVSDLLAFASSVSPDIIRRARLHARDARLLLDSLQEYAANWYEHQRGRADKTRRQFEDGADYHMSRISELMASHRAARKGTRDQRGDPMTPEAVILQRSLDEPTGRKEEG